MKGDDLSVKLKDTQQYYHEVLKRISPKSHPVFEDPGMQERVWGRRWGVYDDVGPLKLVLVHRPGNEIKVMTKKKYDPSIEAMIDDDEQWYVLGEEPPNLEKMQEEHDQLMNILRKEGVEVMSVEGSPRDPKAMFTRDDGVAIQGGFVVGRMGAVGKFPGTGRRGEEAFVIKKIVELGMPILRTIHGSGLFEGGSFSFLNEQNAVIGLSYRQNEEAVRQIEEVLRVQGTRLIRVPLVGYNIHIDVAIVMVDRDLALVNITQLPYWFPETLNELKIRFVDIHHADNFMVINCLAVRPGKVIMAINNGEGTAERLMKNGVEVIPIDYSECQKSGGGIHCSTLPLIRERD
jgi:N-dimethylarginine dimethylaminohydrolase